MILCRRLICMGAWPCFALKGICFIQAHGDQWCSNSNHVPFPEAGIIFGWWDRLIKLNTQDFGPMINLIKLCVNQVKNKYLEPVTRCKVLTFQPDTHFFVKNEEHTTHRYWLLLCSSDSSLKMCWWVKVSAHFPLTSSLHEVHTNCNHTICTINRHMWRRMCISALFSRTWPSLIFSTHLEKQIQFHLKNHAMKVKSGGFLKI